MTTQVPVRRRRGRRGVLLVALLVLVIVGLVVAEFVLRSVVSEQVSRQVAAALRLPSAHAVAVDLAVPVLPQVLAGRLGSVGVTADDVVLGPLVGRLEAEARGVPLQDGAATESLTATMRVDEDDAAALVQEVAGVSVDSFELREPDVLVGVAPELFGIAVPVVVGLQPGAAEGDLTLTPASVGVAGRTLTVEELRRSEFAGVAEPLLAPHAVCIADQLPAAVRLTDVAVDGRVLVLTVAADDIVLGEQHADALGRCP